MVDQIEKFVVEFFKNLKCDVTRDDEVLVVSNVPKSFEDLYGKSSPYRISFKDVSGADFVGRGSSMLSCMRKFLDGAGKSTLLKIDFDVDPLKEIGNVISLKNCEIGNIEKRHKNNFFSRFTFVTTFRYLNKSEQIVNEVYVHDGEVVKGDLSGYTVLEGEEKEATGSRVKEDFVVARNSLKGVIEEKSGVISKILESEAEVEIKRIDEHYDNLLSELGGDLNEQLSKVKDMELLLRTAEESVVESLRAKLDRLRKGLVKMGDDESRSRILKEKEFTVKDAMNKHSLNIDNKLVNTTVIYYPVFNFNLYLKGNDGDSQHKNINEDSAKDVSGRFVEMVYNPLTRSLNSIYCESCGLEISKINLCSGGHLSCDDCLGRCSECGKSFCVKCLGRNCSVCGRPLCKSCSKVCLGCGHYVCNNHLRRDCVSGEDRCTSCLRACMRCHGMSQEKYFGEAMDGSKVCQKCLGEERRAGVMKRIFER